MSPPRNGTLVYRVQRLEDDVQKLRDMVFRMIITIVGALLTFVVTVAVLFFT